ncbi:MAG TPA: hypothetical protein DD706_14600 [Nitrospiraceae bacterium]|nr:hypothetical protein [Nitrospiraceae bacterium]
MKRLRNTILNLSLIILSLVIFLFFAEIAFSIYQSKPEPENEVTPQRVTTTKPYLYQNNPAHHDINAHGLRDDNFSAEKPEGSFRILVLGDSIPFGKAVPTASTFPNKLESLLKDSGQMVEVINTGVSGYTPYNELHYYLSEGRKFNPDLVILSFCMNDVVNPRLHWNNFAYNAIPDIPEEAIPNKDYDRNVIQPRLNQREDSRRKKLQGVRALFPGMIFKTRTYQFVANRWAALFPPPEIPKLSDEIPTYLTGEDNISIEVITHADSEEWQWLTGMYDQINLAVSEDHIPLVIMIFPLAYQLDTHYPHFPQNLFADYCRNKNLHCLDLLEPFRRHGKEKIFMLDKGRSFYDVWHLTLDGHTITAEILFDYLHQQNLTTNQEVPGT